MTAAAVDIATDRHLRPFATAAIVSVAAFDTILHCVAITLGSGNWFGEVYMLAIGRYHLNGDRQISHLCCGWAPPSRPRSATTCTRIC